MKMEKFGETEDRRLVVKLRRVFETAVSSFVEKRFRCCIRHATDDGRETRYTRHYYIRV